MIAAAAAAAIAAIASLAQKSAADAEEARRINNEKRMNKQAEISGILSQRAQAGGVNTSQSGLAGRQLDFMRQLNASHRDSSGDFVPLTNAVAGIGSSLVDSAGKPQAASVPSSNVNFQGYAGGDSTAGASPSLDDYDPEKRKYLLSLASRGMTA